MIFTFPLFGVDVKIDVTTPSTIARIGYLGRLASKRHVNCLISPRFHLKETNGVNFAIYELAIYGVKSKHHIDLSSGKTVFAGAGNVVEDYLKISGIANSVGSHKRKVLSMVLKKRFVLELIKFQHRNKLISSNMKAKHESPIINLEYL